MEEQEKNRLLKDSEIGIWLDSYDDIFSDFDPRPYSQRSVSGDLLNEAKKASRDKTSGQIQLKFLVPKKGRNYKNETLIKKRLKDHFKKHSEIMRKEHRKIIREGIFFLFLGVLFMIIAGIFLIEEETTKIKVFLSVFLEPGGWFLFWEGLYLIVFESRKKNPDLGFYKKMNKAEITFVNC